MENNYIKIFACCIITKGVKRATLIDLQRHKYIFLPLQIANILEELNTTPLDKLLDDYNNDDQIELMKYFKYLIEYDYAFYTSFPESFPKIDLKWKSNSLISNAILDYDNNTKYDVINVVEQLEELGCHSLQIRIFSGINYDNLVTIIKAIENGRGVIRNVQLLIPYNVEYSLDMYFKIHLICNRVYNITVHTTPENENVIKHNKNPIVKYINQSILDETHCGFISPKYFRFNMNFFTESQNFNTCLNKKISIDKNGLIKNCPAMKTNYGNFETTSLKSALADSSFTDMWQINKNQIDICKVCEFRHACTDCRAFVESTESLYSKPLKCKYNPYMMHWEMHG